MTPLEAAKALALPKEPHENQSVESSVLCQYCGSNGGEWSGQQGASPWYILHEATCPLFQMPKIIAALEAATEIIGANLIDVSDHGPCPFCGGNMKENARQNGYDHYDGCPWQALQGALKVEMVPSEAPGLTT